MEVDHLTSSKEVLTHDKAKILMGKVCKFPIQIPFYAGNLQIWVVAKSDQEELGLVGCSPPTKAIPVAEATKFSSKARKGDEEGDVSKDERDVSMGCSNFECPAHEEEQSLIKRVSMRPKMCSWLMGFIMGPSCVLFWTKWAKPRLLIVRTCEAGRTSYLFQPTKTHPRVSFFFEDIATRSPRPPPSQQEEDASPRKLATILPCTVGRSPRRCAASTPLLSWPLKELSSILHGHTIPRRIVHHLRR